MKKYFVVFIFALLASTPAAALAAPGDILWEADYSTRPGLDRDQANSVASGPGGVIAVAGFASETAGNFDYLTVLYGPKGDILWTKRYDHSWYDAGKAVAFDSRGNIFVAGTSNNLNNPMNIYSGAYYTDYRIIKYSKDGELLMETSASGRLNKNEPAAMAVDKYGNIFVTGFAMNAAGTYPMYYTVCFHKNGEIAWENYEDAGAASQAAGIALDPDGNVLVTGWYRVFETGQFAIRTFLYSPEDGKTIWQNDFKPQFDNVQAYGIASDEDGNIIMTGETNAENGTTLTLKYNPAQQVLWASKFTGSEYRNIGSSVAVDEKGRIYVAGRTFKEDQGGDWLLLAYDKDGALLSFRTYPFGGGSFASSITLEPSGDLLVAGTAQPVGESGRPTTPQFKVIRVEGWQSLDRPLGEFFNPNAPIKLNKPEIGILRKVELKARRFEPGDRKSPIKVTATPVAGPLKYEYKFFISSGEKWVPVGDYTPLNKIVLPAKQEPGSRVMVYVRAIGSPLPYEAAQELDISDVY